MSGYICKKCGGPSPTGVGYASQSTLADTSAALTQCACGHSVSTMHGTCRHCGRDMHLLDGLWIDEQATGDDSVWRETCDANDTFEARHDVA